MNDGLNVELWGYIKWLLYWASPLLLIVLALQYASDFVEEVKGSVHQADDDETY